MSTTRDALAALIRIDIWTVVLVGLMFSRANDAVAELVLGHNPQLAVSIAVQGLLAGGWAWTRVQLLKARATAVTA
jgi:hypothetical protein